MHSMKTDGQQWSIRAEFTVSPQEVSETNPASNSIQDKSAIRLSYFWKLNETSNANDNTNYRPLQTDSRRPVEYKKGNLVFTSLPPSRPPYGPSNLEVPDSGYGSDILSLNSFANRSPVGNPSGRKCRSTCNIILSSNVTTREEQELADQSKCKRIHSLRCQTPILHSLQQKQETSFYGCGDPWCHHVIEEEPALHPQTKYATLPPYYNTNLKDNQPPRKDVSIQTSNSLEKCSVRSTEGCKKKKLKGSGKTSSNKRSANSCGQSLKADSGEKSQPSTSKNVSVDKNYGIAAHSNDSSKKPRTIHIDVYCTDTEMEPSGTSSDSWENDSSSTHQTVFESDKVCVTHERAKDNALPFRLKRFYNRSASTATSVERDDSDIDDVSTAYYPSKIDSYSTINDFSSSISSFKSWKDYSMTSCTNDCDTDNFSKISLCSNSDKPVSYKPPSIGRYFNTHNRQFRNQSDKSVAYGKSQPSSLHSSMEQDIPKEHILKRQNPDGSDNVDNVKSYDLPFPENYLLTYNEIPNKSHAFNIKEEIPLPKPLQQKLSDVNTKTHSPNTVLSGKYTEQIASRFGQVINIFNKPGRHVGPTKNPDCGCSSCKRYFEYNVMPRMT